MKIFELLLSCFLGLSLQNQDTVIFPQKYVMAHTPQALDSTSNTTFIQKNIIPHINKLTRGANVTGREKNVVLQLLELQPLGFDNATLVKEIIEKNNIIFENTNLDLEILNTSIRNANIEILELLLKRNAPINNIDSSKKPPLLWAFHCKHHDKIIHIVKLLLSSGAHVHHESFTNNHSAHLEAALFKQWTLLPYVIYAGGSKESLSTLFDYLNGMYYSVPPLGFNESKFLVQTLLKYLYKKNIDRSYLRYIFTYELCRGDKTALRALVEHECNALSDSAKESLMLFGLSYAVEINRCTLIPYAFELLVDNAQKTATTAKKELYHKFNSVEQKRLQDVLSLAVKLPLSRKYFIDCKILLD